MITDKDIEKLTETFITKEEHKASIDRIIKYIDYRLEPLDELIREFREFKEQMSKTMDFLVGVYQKLTDEHIVAAEQYSRTNRIVENHETRITSLEKKVN